MKKHYISLCSLVISCCATLSVSAGLSETPEKKSSRAVVAPVAYNDEGATLVNTQTTINVVANDKDADGNNTIDITTVDLNTSQSNIQTTATNSSGSWSVNAGIVTYTPANNFNGVATLNYYISDNGGTRSSNAGVISIAVKAYPNNQPSSDPFTLFTDYPRVKLYSWADNYLSYEYNTPYANGYGLRFRMAKPNGYTIGGGPKYPLIIFLHGSGEAGSPAPILQNNELQLVHGGQTHLNAVTNGTFPGFLLYPQLRKTGCTANPNDPAFPFDGCGAVNWGSEWREAVRGVIDVLIANYDVDPNRVYIHGLSGGGQGTWQFISDYPEYFAAAHPMSAAGSQFLTGGGFGASWSNYIHIPLRLAQGGLDPAPPPADGNAQVNTIRANGGSIRYSYYPTTGHGTWNSEYAKSDFFSWFLSKNKASIFVFDEQTSFCPGESFSVKLGLSKTVYPNGRPAGGGVALNPNRIINYEWYQGAQGPGGTLIASGAAANEITVSTPGTYYARFQRVNNTWSDWASVTLDNNRGPSTTPLITNDGRSVNLPALDGSAEVILFGTAGKAVYDWKRNTSTSVGSNANYTASVAGSYTLISKDAAGSPYEPDGVTPREFRAVTQGCFSNPSSPIVVTTVNGPNSPAPPGNFFAGSLSQTSIGLSWQDRSTNETGFELYRSSTSSNSGYVLVSILPANTVSYTDNGLINNTTYYYRLRAVNTDGGSGYTPVAQATTNADSTPPTAPIISAGSSSRTVINLTWATSPGTDNVGITEYDIYQNGALIGTTSATSFAVTSVVAFTQYYFTVKARDAADNVSPASNQLTAAAINAGLFYSYYHHNGISSTTNITTNGTLIKTGLISTFSTSPKTRNENHAFIYEGFINIPSAGTYTFYTTSDDGSQLFINNNTVALVDNDGPHGDQERSGSITFSPGTYPQAIPIKVTYYQGTGGASLTVRWQGPSIGKQVIPASVLSDNYTPPAGPNPPTVFRMSTVQPTPAFDRVWVQWVDNSTNETGFEISRLRTNSSSSNGTYSGTLPSTFPVIATLAANTTTFNDIGLEPNTLYYYRIRSINNSGASSWVNFDSNGATSGGTSYIITATAPVAPAVPSPLTANAVSQMQVNLSWTNVTGETGYEIQKSSSASTGFVTIGTTAADVTTFNDTQATGHTTYYYQVRARGNGSNHSAYTTPSTAATTPNSIPVITPVSSQSVLANATTNINITVTDADLDPLTVTFGFTGVQPDSYIFNSDGFGTGTLSVTYGNVSGASTVLIQANDGLNNATSADPDFVLTVGNNQGPVLTGVSVNGTPISPVPAAVPNQSVEEGRSLVLAITMADNVGNTTIGTPTISLPPALASLGIMTTNTGSGNPRTFTITFATRVGDIGIYDNIKVTFSDGAGGINEQTFSLVVTPVDKDFKIYLNYAHFSSHFETGVWNNTGPRGTVTLTNLKDDNQDILKDITIGLSSSWDAANSGQPGTFYADLPSSPNPIYTEKVRESFFRAGSFATQGIPTTFNNLNKALKYRAIIYAGSLGGAEARYRLTGSTTAADVQLVSANNISQTTTTDWVFPNTSGVIELRTFRVPGSGTFYINAVVLEAQYVNTNVAPEMPLALAGNAPAHNQVVLTWDDASFNETGFRVYRSTSPSGPWTTPLATLGQNIETYTDNAVTGRTTYYYRVSAFNNVGESALTASVIISTPNGVPVLSAITPQIVRVGEVLQTNFSATDPENDPLTFTLVTNPGFANLVDNGNGTGFITFSPSNSQAGVYNITLRVQDNATATAEVTFQVQAIDSEYDQAFYLNFLSTSSTAPAPWVNKLFLTATGSMINSLGVESPTITFAKSANFTWGGTASDGVLYAGAYDGGDNNSGINTGSNTGLYPDNVMKSNWTSVRTDNQATISFINLNPAKKYNLTLFGSRDEFWFAESIFTIETAGAPIPAAKSLNISKNKSQVVRFTGLSPNISGTITFSVKKNGTILNDVSGTANDVTYRNAALNALILEEYSETTTPRRPSSLVARGLSKTSIRLTWNDNSSDETGFEISRATDPAGPFSVIFTTAANVETYDNTSLTQNTAYVYRVRALKASGNSAYTEQAIASTFNEVILLNLTPNGQTNGGIAVSPPWNNGIDGDPKANTTYGPLNDYSGAATTLQVQIINTGNGPNGTLGVLDGGYTDAPGIYPVEVQKNYIYWLPNDPASDIQLNGLNPNMNYDLLFYTNEWNFTKVNAKLVTDFIVNGQTLSQFNGRNLTETSNFYNLQPQDNAINFQIKANSEGLAAVLSAIEIHSYTPLDAAFDITPPTVPTGLVATEVNDDSVHLSWNPSTDNIAVAGYEVFQGSTLAATVTVNPDTTVVINGLQPLTTYTFSVRAFDSKGNRSALSTGIQVTTLSSSETLTLYYPLPTGDITDVNTWGRNTDGTGSHPLAFTNTNNQQFVLNRDASIASPLTISGTNSRLVVSTGVTLTINNTLDCLIDTEGDGEVIVATATAPQFGTLSSTSTVSFSGNPNVIPGGTYGNLILSGDGSAKNFSTGTYTVNGNLEIDGTVALNGATNNSTTLVVAGNLTIQGSPVMPADNQLFTLNFTGTNPTLTGNSITMRFASLNVTNNAQLKVVNTGPTVNTLQLGTPAGGGLIIENGASLDLGNNDLLISGQGSVNASNQTGALKVSKGDITINSTGAQISNLYFTPLYDTIGSITLAAANSAQVNVRTKMYVREHVNVTTGHIGSSGNIVLVSDASGTARIAPIGATASIIGAVEFQRYYDVTGRVYRYVSTPIFNTSVATWINYFRVTGPFSGGSTGPNTSLFYYDEDGYGGYAPFPEVNSGEFFTVGRGYSLFIYNGANPNKLQLTGPIQQGNFTFPNLASGSSATNDGWSLVGNPYASPIQWGDEGWIKTNIRNTIYLRENDKVGETTVTNVKWWDATENEGSDGYNGVIAQGQAFWIKAEDTSPSLGITENAKANALNTGFYRTGSKPNKVSIVMSNTKYSDKALIVFREGARTGLDNDTDAIKLDNSFFNISTLGDQADLVLNRMPADFCSQTIKLNVKSATTGAFKLAFNELSSFEYPVVAKLKDNFTQKEVTLSEGSVYNFDVTTNPASIGKDRFELTIAKPELNSNVTFASAAASSCDSGDAAVTLNNTQAGARYEILVGETVVGSMIGNGGDASVVLNKAKLINGNNTLTFRGGFDGCDQAVFTSTLNLNFVPKPVATLVDGVLVSSSATGNQWLRNGHIIPGATGITFIPEESGDYAVTTIGASCEVISDPITFNITGVEDPDRKSFVIYPNPVKNNFVVKLPVSVRENKRADITLYTTAGVQVARFRKANKKEGIELNGADLTSGLYTIKVEADGQVLERKLIRE